MDSILWYYYSGQCKTLGNYLTTYGKPDVPVKLPTMMPSPTNTTNIVTIPKEILKDSVKVLYLFQCFQEAQDNKLCEILSRSFDSGVISISKHSLLPHQVVSLGFFLSRSHRKWKNLNFGWVSYWRSWYSHTPPVSL